MPICLLAVDTATEACSVALLHGARRLERFEVAGREHTQRLLPMVHQLMAESGLGFAEIDGLVCGVGPGSFAGVRIAVGFIKGLGLALDRPVVGVSSLAMLSLAAIRGGAPGAIATIDARMEEVYVGVYAAHPEGCRLLAPERVMAPGSLRLDPALASYVGVGSGWGRPGPALIDALGWQPPRIDAKALPRAMDALALALPSFERGETESPDSLSPLYLRERVALTLDEQAIAKAADRR